MPETPEYGLDYPGDKDAPNGAAQIKALAEAVETALAVAVPPGTIVATARKTAPTGWLMCEGQAVSRTTYKRLYEAIKDSNYGAGNGSTTFNLPDGRGRVLVGVDGAAARLTANDAIGNSGGEEKHTLTTAELAAHTHGDGSLSTTGSGTGISIQGVGDHTHGLNAAASYGGGGGVAITGEGGNRSTSGAGGHSHGVNDPGHSHDVQGATASSGSGTGHNNMQPYLVANHMIKV